MTLTESELLSAIAPAISNIVGIGQKQELLSQILPENIRVITELRPLLETIPDIRSSDNHLVIAYTRRGHLRGSTR